jgi:hypothetical protein
MNERVAFLRDIWAWAWVWRFYWSGNTGVLSCFALDWDMSHLAFEANAGCHCILKRYHLRQGDMESGSRALGKSYHMHG